MINKRDIERRAAKIALLMRKQAAHFGESLQRQIFSSEEPPFFLPEMSAPHSLMAQEQYSIPYESDFDQSKASSGLSPLSLALILAGLGASGYLVGRYGPSEPEKPGRNEALYGAVSSALLPPAGIGYGIGRRVARGKNKKTDEED